MSRVVVAIFLATLLTGCSSSSPNQGSYDPVELIEYENCLAGYKGSPFAEAWCEDKKPIRR